MEHLPNKIANKLAERLENNALRNLGVYQFACDFATNDYLSVITNPIATCTSKAPISGLPGGASGSRLLTGNTKAHAKLEQDLAVFHNVQGALVFNSGYAANLGLLGSVPQKGDLVLYDQFVHASIRDGIMLCPANSFKFKHNSLSDLAQLIERHNKKFDHIYVVTESVFSMDGDSPDLKALCDLCDATDCYLIVDEAHAVGVFGDRGQGLLQQLGLEQRVFARVITFGKAIGAHGAAVLGDSGLKQYLVNFARSLIYTTALPPGQITHLINLYNWLKESPEFLVRQNKLHANIKTLQQAANAHNIHKAFTKSNSAIHCCVIPGNSKVKQISDALQKLGFGVLPILAPTVPIGQERIRICLHAHNSQQEITGLINALSAVI